MSTVLFAGAHRGGSAIVKELQDETVRRYDPNWLLVDPKPDRAAQLAKMAQNRFATLRPQSSQMKVQDALAYSSDYDSVILALDTLADTTETVAARLPFQRVSFQLVGRGPGDAAGTRLAIQGTICPEDHDTARRVLLLLQTLAGMAQAASSRRLTGQDPLSAVVLKPLRQVASRQTARHLAEKEREPEDLSGGPLSVSFGQTIYPLIPVQGVAQNTTHSGKLSPWIRPGACR